MDPHTSTLESDVSTNGLNRKIDNSANELSRKIDDSNSELKYELNRRFDELDRKMDRLHNEQRQDLYKYSAEVRNWFLGTVIGLFVAFGSMTFAMFNIIKP